MSGGIRQADKNMNFDKAHMQPLSLLRLDSSTYIETLGSTRVGYLSKVL